MGYNNTIQLGNGKELFLLIEKILFAWIIRSKTRAIIIQTRTRLADLINDCHVKNLGELAGKKGVDQTLFEQLGITAT